MATKKRTKRPTPAKKTAPRFAESVRVGAREYLERLDGGPLTGPLPLQAL